MRSAAPQTALWGGPPGRDSNLGRAVWVAGLAYIPGGGGRLGQYLEGVAGLANTWRGWQAWPVPGEGGRLGPYLEGVAGLANLRRQMSLFNVVISQLGGKILETMAISSPTPSRKIISKIKKKNLKKKSKKRKKEKRCKPRKNRKKRTTKRERVSTWKQRFREEKEAIFTKLCVLCEEHFLFHG